MNNISLNQEPINLNKDINYIVIDALYINEIKNEVSNLNADNLLKEIRSKVFPYSETPFAEYKANENSFSINQIKKVDFDSVKSIDPSIFSSDTGVIVFINNRILLQFIEIFDYNDLTDSSDELLNFEYWDTITQNFDPSDIAIIVSPGIESSVEFEGSGTYRVL